MQTCLISRWFSCDVEVRESFPESRVGLMSGEKFQAGSKHASCGWAQQLSAVGPCGGYCRSVHYSDTTGRGPLPLSAAPRNPPLQGLRHWTNRLRMHLTEGSLTTRRRPGFFPGSHTSPSRSFPVTTEAVCPPKHRVRAHVRRGRAADCPSSPRSSEFVLDARPKHRPRRPTPRSRIPPVPSSRCSRRPCSAWPRPGSAASPRS